MNTIDHAGEAPGLMRIGDAWIRPSAVNALKEGAVSATVTTVYLSSGQTLTVQRMSPSQVVRALKIGDPE